MRGSNDPRSHHLDLPEHRAVCAACDQAAPMNITLSQYRFGSGPSLHQPGSMTWGGPSRRQLHREGRVFALNAPPLPNPTRTQSPRVPAPGASGWAGARRDLSGFGERPILPHAKKRGPMGGEDPFGPRLTPLAAQRRISSQFDLTSSLLAYGHFENTSARASHWFHGSPAYTQIPCASALPQ